MNIRKAKLKDAKEISEIIISNLKLDKSKESKELIEEYAPKYIKEGIKNSLWVVAVENNKIVGSGRIIKNYICGMYILSKKQGRGIGSKILKYLEKASKKNKITKIYLNANKKAIHFYYKHGYNLKKGKNPNLIMIKNLASKKI